MASVAVTINPGGVSIGRVFERAFATLRNNPVTTILVALLFGGIPAAAINYLTNQIPSAYLVMTFGSWVLPSAVAVFLVQLFFGQVVGVVALGAIFAPVQAEAEGRKAKLGEALLSTLTALISLVGLGLLFGTGIVIGLTLLVIPAFVIYLLWAFAAPALVAEREGVVLAITRSQELSEGARWKCLGTLAVPFVISLLVGIAIGLLSRLFLGTVDPSEAPIGMILYWVLLGSFTNLLWGLTQASLYVELRDWKDGPAATQLAEIFA